MCVKDKDLEELNKEIERLNEEVNRLKAIVPLINNDNSSIPVACRHCSCHPSNGGNGICNCTLGMTQVTC